MLPHFRHLLGSQLARLVQHSVGHANFADVVQGGEVGQKLNALGREVVAIGRVGGELLGQHACHALRPARVTSGFRVADPGERQEGLHHQLSGRFVRLARLVRSGPFGRESRDGHGGEAGDESERGKER
jgi:hypothetical protein